MIVLISCYYHQISCTSIFLMDLGIELDNIFRIQKCFRLQVAEHSTISCLNKQGFLFLCNKYCIYQWRRIMLMQTGSFYFSFLSPHSQQVDLVLLVARCLLQFQASHILMQLIEKEDRTVIAYSVSVYQESKRLPIPPALPPRFFLHISLARTSHITTSSCKG